MSMRPYFSMWLYSSVFHRVTLDRKLDMVLEEKAFVLVCVDFDLMICKVIC